MSWTHLTLVTDADLAALEPEAGHPSEPWGQTAWTAARAEAKRDLQIWIDADYATIPAASDRVLDRWAPELVFAYTGSGYTDRTSEVSSSTEEDLNLATVFTTFGTDCLYVGAGYEFNGLFWKLLDSLNANASVMTVKYWNSAGWTTLSATDGTIAVTGKTLSGSGRVTWTLPSTWERRTLNGSELYYWVQVTISAALTAGTAATQILPIRPPAALKRVAAYLSLHHICQGLAAQAATPEYWAQKAEAYWTKAQDLYTRIRQGGGIPFDLDQDDVIEPVSETTFVTTTRIHRA